MQHLSLTLGGEAMVGGKQRGKELRIAERLRREPRDPDQVLARCMQPRSGQHDLEEGFSPWFPASRFDETTEAEIAMPITCQGLGNKRRRGIRGTRSRGWSGRKVRKTSCTNTSTEDGTGPW